MNLGDGWMTPSIPLGNFFQEPFYVTNAQNYPFSGRINLGIGPPVTTHPFSSIRGSRRQSTPTTPTTPSVNELNLFFFITRTELKQNYRNELQRTKLEVELKLFSELQLN